LLINLVNGADIGVIQGGGRLRLALETGQCLRVSGNLLRQKLESDETMESGVFGFVDNTHPTTAQLLKDAVMRDGLAEHWTTGERSPWAAMLSVHCPPS